MIQVAIPKLIILMELTIEVNKKASISLYIKAFVGFFNGLFRDKTGMFTT
jgi:hypothetical protein